MRAAHLGRWAIAAGVLWVATSCAAAQTPSREYIRLGGRVIAIESPSTTVTVSCGSTALGPGEQRQCTATVSGTTNPSVTWAVPAGTPGTINTSGLYTAPASITEPATVVVTASSAQPAGSGTASIAIDRLLNPAGATVGAAGVTNATFRVTKNSAWSAVSNNAWIQVVSGGDTQPGDVVYTVQPNAGSFPRTGTISVAGGTFTITQEGTSLSPSEMVFPAAGGSQNVSVSFAGPWAVTTASPWITFTPGSGNGNGTVSITTSPNMASSSRSGTVNIGAAVLTATQAACSMVLNPASAPSVSGAAQTLSVNVTSTCAGWTATTTAGWIKNISPASGSGNGMIQYQVEANTGSTARTGTIVIGGASFVVTQGVLLLPSYEIVPAYVPVNAGATQEFQFYRVTGSERVRIADVNWAIGPQNRGYFDLDVYHAPTTGFSDGALVTITGTTAGGGASATVVLRWPDPGYGLSITPATGIGAGADFDMASWFTSFPWQQGQLLFATSSTTGAGACAMLFATGSGTGVWLTADDGMGTVGGRTLPGTESMAPRTYPLFNSQCAIDPERGLVWTQWSPPGGYVHYRIPVLFKPAFGGTQQAWLKNMPLDAWQPKGTWNVTPPADLFLTNLALSAGAMDYRALNTITASSNVTIGGSAAVSFEAGVRVTLGAGFKATAGTAGITFRARISE